MKLSANRSRFWSVLIATMRSWGLSNASAKTSLSFATKQFICARTAVLAQINRFVAKDRLVLAEAFDNPQLLIVAIRTDQNRDRFADNFISAVTKKPFRSLVPAGDYFVEIFAYYRISRTFDDGSQTAICLLGAFSLGNVA